MLSVALHVAAYDKRINDESWRGLDVGRKEILLPLGEDRLLRAAARRVSSLKLSQRATRDLFTPRVVELVVDRPLADAVEEREGDPLTLLGGELHRVSEDGAR